MIHAQNAKKGVIVIPQSVATNATASGSFDCLGYEYAEVDVILDTAAATSNNPATVTLYEGDTSTAFTAIAAFTGDDTTNGFTIPAADTSVAVIYGMFVDLRKRKRYLKLALTTAGAAQICGATYRLSRADEAPNTATERGLAVQKIG